MLMLKHHVRLYPINIFGLNPKNKYPHVPLILFKKRE